MALPKRRVSKARKRKRRAHQALAAPNYGFCKKCNKPVRPHTACPSCGYYSEKVSVES